MAHAKRKADITALNHGSVWILEGVSSTGRRWMDEHLPDDAPAWGLHGVAVEARFVADIVEGARADGLEVK